MCKRDNVATVLFSSRTVLNCDSVHLQHLQPVRAESTDTYLFRFGTLLSSTSSGVHFDVRLATAAVATFSPIATATAVSLVAPVIASYLGCACDMFPAPVCAERLTEHPFSWKCSTNSAKPGAEMHAAEHEPLK